jgi:hypothetical protein
LARNGQIDRAIALTERKFPSGGNVGMKRYNAACIYSLGSTGAFLSPERKEEVSRRAVELLVEAKAAGHFNDPNQVAHATADKDLDSIRGRADFREKFAGLLAPERGPPPHEVKP